MRVLRRPRIAPLLAVALVGALASGSVAAPAAAPQVPDPYYPADGNVGYVNFIPQPVMEFDEQKKVVNLTVNVDEGPQFTVNRISFTGNMTTPDEVIRREILVKEGEVFNTTLWGLSVLRLNQLGFFEEIKPEDAWIQPLPDEAKVDINLRVREKAR